MNWIECKASGESKFNHLICHCFHFLLVVYCLWFFFPSVHFAVVSLYFPLKILTVFFPISLQINKYLQYNNVQKANGSGLTRTVELHSTKMVKTLIQFSSELTISSDSKEVSCFFVVVVAAVFHIKRIKQVLIKLNSTERLRTSVLAKRICLILWWKKIQEQKSASELKIDEYMSLCFAL